MRWTVHALRSFGFCNFESVENFGVKMLCSTSNYGAVPGSGYQVRSGQIKMLRVLVERFLCCRLVVYLLVNLRDAVVLARTESCVNLLGLGGALPKHGSGLSETKSILHSFHVPVNSACLSWCLTSSKVSLCQCYSVPSSKCLRSPATKHTQSCLFWPLAARKMLFWVGWCAEAHQPLNKAF